MGVHGVAPFSHCGSVSMAGERGPAHKELAIKGKDERAGRRAKGRSGQWKQGPMRSKSNLGYGFSIWNQIL